MSDLVKTIEEKVKAITDTGIFELNGKTVEITPLQFQYQQQFTKVFQPIVEAISLQLASNERIVWIQIPKERHSIARSVSKI